MTIDPRIFQAVLPSSPTIGERSAVAAEAMAGRAWKSSLPGLSMRVRVLTHASVLFAGPLTLGFSIGSHLHKLVR